MSSRDVLADFPSTHATYLATRIDDGGEAALREARVHLMQRYRAALVAYASHSRADIDGHGVVDGVDLANIFGNWGPCP